MSESVSHKNANIKNLVLDYRGRNRTGTTPNLTVGGCYVDHLSRRIFDSEDILEARCLSTSLLCSFVNKVFGYSPIRVESGSLYVT